MSGDEPATKKARTSTWVPPSHKMNIVEAVDAGHEKDGFNMLADAPASAIQGLGSNASEVLAALGVDTVRDLAEYKYACWAQAIVTLAEFEVEGKRPEGCALNADQAVTQEYEEMSLKEMCALPIDALQGLADDAKEQLKKIHIDTIEKLGTWKYIKTAQAIVALADREQTLSPEERHAQTLLKRLE
mmetsp:Transcript_9737/g.25966  ORF Transcript_9737/g.25966 Transcript_9737/m.25966 type:complete len:187 (+) Transcript_9737:69-629(+)